MESRLNGVTNRPEVRALTVDEARAELDLGTVADLRRRIGKSLSISMGVLLAFGAVAVTCRKASQEDSRVSAAGECRRGDLDCLDRRFVEERSVSFDPGSMEERGVGFDSIPASVDSGTDAAPNSREPEEDESETVPVRK